MLSAKTACISTFKWNHPSLSRSFVIKDTSLEGVAQCITEVNNSAKAVDSIDHLQLFVPVFTDICFQPKNKHGPTINDVKTQRTIMFFSVCKILSIHWCRPSMPFRFKKTCYLLVTGGNLLLWLQTTKHKPGQNLFHVGGQETAREDLSLYSFFSNTEITGNVHLLSLTEHFAEYLKATQTFAYKH